MVGTGEEVMRKILCFIGFHDWEYMYERCQIEGYFDPGIVFMKCRRCGKEKSYFTPTLTAEICRTRTTQSIPIE